MQRHFDTAYQIFLEIQTRAQKAHFESLESRAVLAKATILNGIGSYRQGINLDAEGLARYRSGAATVTQARQLYYDMGTSAANLGHSTAAGALISEAVEVAALFPDRSTEAMTRSRYADLLFEQNRLAEAGRELDRAQELMRSAPNSDAKLLYGFYVAIAQARFDGQQAKPENALKQLDLMEQKLAKSKLGPVQNPAVQNLIWEVKSELLTRAGRQAESEQPLQRLLEAGTAARNGSSGVGDPSVTAREISRAVNILADLYLRQGNAPGAWRVWTRFNPCFQTIPVASAGSVRLLFAELPSGLTVWIYGAGEPQAERLSISGPELRRLAGNFRRMVANPEMSLDRIRVYARQLSSQVLGPIESRLEGIETLYIAADGPFASIPFAALVSEDGRWLADRFRVVYSPPLAGISQPAPGGLAASTHVVASGFGRAARVFQTDLQSLPDVDADIQAIAHALTDRELLKDGESTVSGVLKALPKAGIFHFSGHAILTAGDAALVLAPEQDDSKRLLWASQIPPQSLRSCRLVMLAACSTGGAADEDDDPSSVMARSFLLMGVPEVIASRWDVNSRATSVLVAAFYREIAKGAKPQDALASAIQELRRQPAYAHPYYWAAFDLFRS